jgi:hypothetical protein
MKSWFTLNVLPGILIAVILAGCAAQSKKPPSAATLTTRALQPAAGKALVYYFDQWAYLGETRIALDTLESSFKQHTYVVWEVDPGEHQLRFTRASGVFQEAVELTIQCDADQIYYFMMTGDTRETHKIVPAEKDIAQSQIAKFNVAGWFKDGKVVPEEPAPTSK